MNDVVALMLNSFLKPKIVHSLEGRVRISVPGLKQVPRDSEVERFFIEEVFRELPGVESVKPNFVTGNILFVYDHHKITEKQILSVIISIVKSIIYYRDRFMNIPEREKWIVLKSIKNFVKELNPHILFSGKEIKLPDDIW